MEDAEGLLQRYVAAWNDQDGKALAALYDGKAERASPLGPARGRQAIRENAERLWRAAPDSRINITHTAVSGDVLLYEFS
jgi:hypothetical protein